MSEFAVEGGDPTEEQAALSAEGNAEVEAPEAVAPAEAPQLDPLELQAELEHMRSQNEELYSILQQFTQQQSGTTQQQVAQAQQQGVDITDEYGNLDPAKFAAYQQDRDSQLLAQVGQMLSPLTQTFEQQREESVINEGMQRLNDILADDISRNGEFATDADADSKAREMVSTIAANLFPELAQRYGNGPRTAEMAMTRAAAEVRGLLRSVGGAAVSQTQNQLATLAGAHGEPGAHGAGVEAPVIRVGDTSAARFAAGAN